MNETGPAGPPDKPGVEKENMPNQLHPPASYSVEFSDGAETSVDDPADLLSISDNTHSAFALLRLICGAESVEMSVKRPGWAEADKFDVTIEVGE